jgi:predicted dehydrogenase
MRYGFVGLGWAARGFHVPALAQVAGAVIVGGCDSSAEQRLSWEKEVGETSYESLDELIAHGSPDVVIIATPPDSHAELCHAALEAGMHVICEKPFVSTTQEADAVLATAAAAGRQVAVNHEFREKPIFKAIAERIGSAEAGELVFCQIWQLMDLAPWDEPVAWRAAMPNRTLFEGGVHLVDLLLFLFGERPEAVFAAQTSGLDPSRKADAIHLVTLEFPRGRLAQLTIDRLCPAGTRYVEVRADCERESLRASLGGRALIRAGMKRAQRTGVRFELASGGLAWAERGVHRTPLAKAKREAGKHATAELFKRIDGALVAGTEPPSSGREARDVLAVIEAAYRSSATGERVTLDSVAANRGASAQEESGPSGHRVPR